MITTLGRILATGIVVALGLGIVTNVAPVSIGQMFLACVGWALAYFGDELAPLIGLEPTPSASQYVGPVIRGIGWLFLLLAFGFSVVRNFRLW